MPHLHTKNFCLVPVRDPNSIMVTVAQRCGVEGQSYRASFTLIDGAIHRAPLGAACTLDHNKNMMPTAIAHTSPSSNRLSIAPAGPYTHARMCPVRKARYLLYVCVAAKQSIGQD
jgi:hypothetical protein